jgi:hypothetical protein
MFQTRMMPTDATIDGRQRAFVQHCCHWKNGATFVDDNDTQAIPGALREDKTISFKLDKHKNLSTFKLDCEFCRG